MHRNPWPGVAQASLFAVISLLSACIDSQGIAPQAERLDVAQLDPGSTIRRAEQEAAWPRARWWRAYGDPQLNAWMDKALADSPSLAMAAARVRQARALAGVVESAEQPQVNLDANVQRKRWPDDYFYGPGELARTTSWNNTSLLGFSYDLDLWGRERSRSHQALDQAQVAVAEARLAALELQGNLVRSYIRLALLHGEKDVAQASLAQQEHILRLAEQRLRDGIGTRLEISRAEAPLPETHRQIDALNESIALTRNQLAALAGKGPGEGERLQRPTLDLQRLPSLPAQLPLELLGRRPDLVASRWQVAAQARGIEVAKAGFYPNINLLGGIGSNATQGGVLDFLRYDKLTYNLGPALSLPMFDGGLRRGQLGAAAAEYDLAVEHYNQTLVGALQQVADALVRIKSLRQQQALAAEAVVAAQKTCDLALLAQQRGLTGFDAVLETQPTLFLRQLQQQQVRAALLNAQADLLLALGGGALPEPVGPSAASLAPREPRLRFLPKP
ncbi:efflux transporter outer membrane subunit [Pseudomonas resinovorans]|uniref:efflux transporter outer membrane subunit n=1 Tax=Metapseudomonas resinovorans TaxID=53412 RepID=UPI00237FC19E|nr:efflux transporter outer membrane subunit [Pseudomonas resinovorans]MDE3737985.1 efflux transporter outer membrane subunit [Pseudomonas resinovorans]